MSRAQRLIQRALSHLPPPHPQNKTIYLALSGGVDSSVAALLLRERGYTVNPQILRCWDHHPDSPTSTTSSPCFERELLAAQHAAQALQLPSDPHVVDLVSTYWTEVFHSVLLTGLSAGQTPNPDLACNKYIKFRAFPKHLSKRLGSDDFKIATGHYARLRYCEERGETELLAGVDEVKDQSYFLASVGAKALSQCVMPVGVLTKEEVRHIAEHARLPAASRRSSRGLCFVGKSQSFPSFASQFLPTRPPAHFVLTSSPSHSMMLAECQWPVWAYTVGQRARVSGQETRLFVVGTRLDDNVVLVAPEDDDRLFLKEVWCPTVDWVSGTEPEQLKKNGEMKVEFKAWSTSERQRGIARKGDCDGIWIEFEERGKRVADGQAVVLYSGEVCLGASWPLDLREWDSRNGREAKPIPEQVQSVLLSSRK